METQGNTYSTFLTRKFEFVLDPNLEQKFQTPLYSQILDLIIDLKTCAQPVEADLLLPTYLTDEATRTKIEKPNSPIYRIKEPKNIPGFKPNSEISEPVRSDLAKEDKDSKRCLSLLALTEQLQADGLITRAPQLINARYPLYQHHRIRIIPPEEVSNLIEICAHGHSVFWSVSNQNRNLYMDIFYLMTHWKASRFFNWFTSKQVKIKNDDLRENLRTVLLTRYSFILYARDMVRFYELQSDYYFRRGVLGQFWMPLGYHVNNFHLFLWGMLDHLTIITKHSRDLKVEEKDCGIRSKKFWKEFGQHEPSLRNYIKGPLINNWISTMADMRHLAAHKTIQTPTALDIETEDSKKSDEEILEILRREEEDIYTILPKDVVKTIESQMIFNWRMRKRKRIAHNVVRGFN